MVIHDMWGILAFVAGLLYGWMKPGRQDKGQLLRTGILVGFLVGVLLGLLGLVAGVNPFLLGNGLLEAVIAVVLLTLLFILGVWVGDLMEGRSKRRIA